MLGNQSLKNISLPVRVLRVAAGNRSLPRPTPVHETDRASIAVRAFDNLSGDPEQDFFADGMVEEIITALSRMCWLLVVARNSSFTGRAVDVKQVGRDLGSAMS